eukprot:GHVQ01027261.1.p1 GENE.GHVQ01027261.1~~GHVQ01027261.1.p1  ORF type:complete len:348 (+),score=53.77 GHVQ01027261.1:1-1044(+)
MIHTYHTHSTHTHTHTHIEMYNYGVDGDETMLQQQQQQPTDGYAYMEHSQARPAVHSEYIATDAESIEEGGTAYALQEGYEPSPRGELHSELVEGYSSNLLRTGLLTQTVSLALMWILFLGFGGSGVFIFDLYAGPESIRVSSAFHLIVSILCTVYLMGTFYIALFQIFVADNSKWSRGFRIGSKLLSSAVMLDIISTSLRLIQYLYAYFYMGMKWWSKFNQSKADFSLFQFGNVINSFALLLYGLAWFYLEAYHDQGTYMQFAWWNLGLFAAAAVGELLMVFTGFGAFFSVVLLMAMVSATMWATSFEPMVQSCQPQLHSRDVNADVMPEPLETDSSKTATTTTLE